MKGKLSKNLAAEISKPRGGGVPSRHRSFGLESYMRRRCKENPDSAEEMRRKSETLKANVAKQRKGG